MFPRKVFLFFSSACSYSGARQRTNIVPGTKTVLRTAKKSCIYIEYYVRLDGKTPLPIF